MEIKYLPVTDLKPYENNPRNNDDAVEIVASSIAEFGFKVPVVLDADNVVVCGHTRRLAAMELGLETVPVVIATDLTEEQVRAFRLADNRAASFSYWDEAKLKDEIAGISEIDLSDFGFKKDKIEDIFREKADKKIHVCPKCGYEWSEEND